MENKMKRNKRIGLLFMALGALLLAGSVLLYGYNRASEQAASKASDLALRQLREQMQQSAGGENRQSGQQELPKETAAEYFGILNVPELGLELPVQSEWSYPKLKETPCVYAGSIESGGLVILAHNYECHFGRLTSLHPGAQILLTNAAGREYRYRVEEIFTMDAADVEKMTDSRYDLTLFTCTYSGKARVTVRCMLENPLDRYPEI